MRPRWLGLLILLAASGCASGKRCCSCVCEGVDAGFCPGQVLEVSAKTGCVAGCADACAERGCATRSADVTADGGCPGGLMPFL